MIYFIQHQGKEYRVRVESRNQQFFVTFWDTSEEPVDLIFYGHDCSFIQANEVFYANVVGNKSDYTVWLPEGNLQFTLESEYRRIVSLLRGQELGQENNIYAKMPGKIVKLLVKPGDTLEKGSPVLVMEAMKMENEIRAGQAGTVSNILVSEGQAVETGTLLVELSSPEED